MKTLNEDIKSGQFKRCYLLCGEDEFLKQSYRNRLMKAIAGDDTMNLSLFEEKDIDEDAVIDAADTMPFFAERRLIVIDGSGWFKGTPPERFTDHIESLPDTTCILFRERDIDKRSRLYKKVAKIGYICEMKHPTPGELSRWAAQYLAKSGKKITASTMDYFLICTGNDMENIRNELDKLISYTAERDVVERADVETVTTVAVTNRIFTMVEAITNRRTAEAMQLYEDLLALKEPPMRILFLIAKQFNQLLEVREMSSAGLDRNTMAAELKVPAFVAGKLEAQSKRYDRRVLQQKVRGCLELEEAVKTGSMPERLAVELLITGSV